MDAAPIAQTAILPLARRVHPVLAIAAIPGVPAIPVSFPHF
jgi:hypothetical protein